MASSGSVDGASVRLSAANGRTRRLLIVAACSQRKRLPPPAALRLRELAGLPFDQRAAAWTERLRSAETATCRAADLYAGAHWSRTLDAVETARRHIDRVELWVASAGYGLVSAEAWLKPYSASFASGARDSVWQGIDDGERPTCLRDWWASVSERRLADLVTGDADAALVLVVGSAYADALRDQCMRSETVTPAATVCR